MAADDHGDELYDVKDQLMACLLAGEEPEDCGFTILKSRLEDEA